MAPHSRAATLPSYLLVRRQNTTPQVRATCVPRARVILVHFKTFLTFGLQLDWVVMTLEALVHSSAPHAPPTTLRAFFDSPG